MKFGIDPDAYFQKDRFSRMMITGASVADGAINNMRQWDKAKERERESERKRKNR